MLAATRAVNGMITLLALFLCYILLQMGVTKTTTPIITGCFLVALFFICDLLFRKEDRRSDLWFAIAWTLFHAFTLYLGMRRFSSEAPPQIWGGLLHTFVVVAFCGLPLVANLVYLVTIRRRIMEAG